jgi:N6-L-threonylcarbamoyladenine synthase
MKKNYILAIDTSCDDTSAAVTSGQQVLSNVIASQTELHKPYGGVFPTVAKLAHKENIDAAITVALKHAHVTMSEVDALAVTVGPGLAPALEVGIAKVKELATQYKKEVFPVNHLAGHILSVLAEPVNSKLQKNAKLPALALIISGGNTQFVLVKDFDTLQVLGSTLDDAAGECLDKIGRMLNLGYPAGPVIEQFAKLGNQNTYPFPLPLTTVKTFDLSFSGLKTFARNLLEKLTLPEIADTEKRTLTKQEVYDFCASAQLGVFRHICYKLEKVLVEVALSDTPIKEVWLGGGVAANMTLRKMLRETLREFTRKNSLPSLRLHTPYTKKLCADNAAMIGIVAGLSNTSPLKPDQLGTLERQPQLRLI